MKFALGIEYNGYPYSGWQKQASMTTSIQAHLEYALSVVADESIKVYCAGRTDAGVHAIGQVVHFDTSVHRKYNAWTLGVNSNLPSDISVRWVSSVPENFHARFSAISRRYQYIIDNYHFRPAIFCYTMTHYPNVLDITAMLRSSRCLIGEHDFTSFRSLKCQSYSPYRTIHHLNIIRKDQYVIIDIKANSFLYHMVRNIIGSLLEVGCGKKSETWIADLLAYHDRNRAGTIASAKGLYLTAIEYPIYFSLPKIPIRWPLSMLE